ncbi:MAG: Abi family protein [Patescibacteria group bacterium]
MKETNIKLKYDKKPLTLDEQVGLLKTRGLIIESEEEIIYYLTNLSYYHLSIYFKYFQKDDKFYEGITFGDILRIYIFDNKLRFLLSEVLERIEKSFKCRMVYSLCVEEDDSHWHLNQKFFDSEDNYLGIINIITENIDKSRELSILHYKETYCDPVLPPIWTTLEILSFGQCCHIYNSLKKEYRNKISRSFGEDEKFINNWMLCSSLLRNHCAHYSRLWNRTLTYTPKMNHDSYKKYFNNGNKRIYNYLVVLQILLNEINPTSSWLDKLKELINEYKINVKQMGFPEDWENKLKEIITNK